VGCAVVSVGFAVAELVELVELGKADEAVGTGAECVTGSGTVGGWLAAGAGLNCASTQ
jgi:hypothetical protein